MKDPEIFYHGTCYLFDHFSLACLGKGEGKSKFGQGIYLTSSYKTAALYAAKAGKANDQTCYYVYTVEVPSLTDDNHIFSCKPVNPIVVARTEEALGKQIPEEVKTAGKFFRKYVGNLLIGNNRTIKQMMSKADSEAESAVSKFLKEIGVIYLAWPQSQTKPDGDTNRALLNETDIKIVKIEQVEVDAKNEFVQGSAKIIKR